MLSSPLGRALDTCRLAGYGDRAELSDALLEWDYGEYEGETTDQIRESRPGWNLWRDGCPGGESVADVSARVDPLVSELKESEADVALFAHGHVLRVLAARWVEMPRRPGLASGSPRRRSRCSGSSARPPCSGAGTLPSGSSLLACA